MSDQQPTVPTPPWIAPGGAAAPSAPPVAPYAGPYATGGEGAPDAGTHGASPAPAFGAPHPAPYGSAAPSAPPSAPQSAPYAAPYVVPAQPQYGAALAAPVARRSSTLGIVALIAAGIAALTPVTAAIASFQIGLGAGKEIALRPPTSDFDLGFLTPVRDWVLLGEVSFWVGTALGVWALVQGIVAIVKNRGRIAGIVAVAVALVACLAFAIVTWVSLTAGLGAGTSIGG